MFDQVQSCVELLTRAKSPVFVLGSQALLPPVNGDELRKAVEKIGIPCFLGELSNSFPLLIFVNSIGLRFLHANLVYFCLTKASFT